ncbi:MAG TPA: Wzz/FepE/Etk N-terminal domain-containing protein [Solirubrobacteraceae bacterium]|nr:Wzz/FepE/Etk N-terminal domain-containing protein [Solirubrobacteraceae bacterium]
MDETTTDASAIFAPLWKRKWMILAAGLLVAVVTYGYYRHKPALYTASTQLYLGGGVEEQGVLGGSQGKSTLNARALSDQAALISSGVLREAVRAKLRREHETPATHGKVNVKSSNTDDFITIQAEAHSGKAAAELANAYAQVYIARQRRDNERVVRAAIARTRHQLLKIEAAPSRAAGARGKSSQVSGSTVLQAASLASKINQLESQLSLSSVQQVGAAKPKAATLVSSSPKHNAIFGFLVGALLAAFAAYALSRFDRRLRSLADIEAALGTQILTALPRTRAPIVGGGGQPVPAPALLEPLRRLHMALRLGDMLEHDRARPPRRVLFVSADPGDGKSTLISGLALVQREAGERVVVVEADLRRPVLARLLDVHGAHGLAEVLAGALPVGAALQRVGTAGAGEPRPLEGAGGAVALAQASGGGSLAVLASGSDVANPPALLAGPGMAELLHGLAEDYDHVLVDAPPPLGVSDVMGLLGAVDGIVLVARVGHTRTASARRLLELLARASSAPVLGVVANCASRADLRAYGFATGYERPGPLARLQGR